MRELWRNHVWSWVSHSVAATMIPAGLMLPVRGFLLEAGFWAFLSYSGGVTIMALIYWYREKRDKAKYGADGKLDERQADLTGRVDGAGDAIGPYTAAVAVLTGLTMFGPWWLPGLPLLLGLGYFGYETGRAAASP